MTSYPNTLITGKYYLAHKAKRHTVWPVIVASETTQLWKGIFYFVALAWKIFSRINPFQNTFVLLQLSPVVFFCACYMARYFHHDCLVQI